MRDTIVIAVTVLLFALSLVAGLSGISVWIKSVNAENDKRQCIEQGYTPVPHYGRYYCR